MRAILYVALAIVLVLIVIMLCKKVLKSILGKVVVLVVAVFLFCGGGTLINLNTLPSDIKSKLDSVVDVLGDSIIRQEGNEVQVKFGDEWYDVSKIGVDGEGSNISITYDGVEIPVGKTGIGNTIDVLEGVGLIKRK